jgi:hypothetical protein
VPAAFSGERVAEACWGQAPVDSYPHRTVGSNSTARSGVSIPANHRRFRKRRSPAAPSRPVLTRKTLEGSGIGARLLVVKLSIRPNWTVAAEVATLPLFPGWIGGCAGSTSSAPGHAQGRGVLPYLSRDIERRTIALRFATRAAMALITSRRVPGSGVTRSGEMVLPPRAPTLAPPEVAE